MSKLTDILDKIQTVKESIKERKRKVLDAKVAKAKQNLKDQEEISEKLQILAKTKQLENENKKMMFQQSHLGKTINGLKKARENLQEYADKIEERNKKKEKDKKGPTSTYDPWNLKSPPFN